jgi:translocation and assembly module TamB
MALLAVVLALALGFALLQTPPGRAGLAAVLARALADPGERITVTGLKGFVPFDMTVERVEIDDSAGPRLVVSDAALAIAPGDLLRGRLTVRRFSARAIEVARPSATPSHFNPAALLYLPVPLRLEALHIDRLALGAAITGEPVALSVTASGALSQGRATADLELHRIDATPGQAVIHLALSGTPPQLDLAADITEPSGKLLADALHAPAPLPLSLHLAGNGPLADWQGSLALHAGDAVADAQFRIHRDGGYHITAAGNGSVASLLPAKLQPLLAGRIDLSASLDLDSERIALTRLRLAGNAVQLSARGSFARASQALTGEAKFDLSDLAALAPLVGAPSRGRADLSLALGGTMRAPRARLTLTGEHLVLGNGRAEAAAATIDLGAAGDPVAPATPLNISASGDLRGIALGPATLPGGLGERLDWRLGARLDRAAERLDLQSLEVDDAGTSVVASAGGNSSSGIEGEALLRVPDIGRFAGAKATGALALAADFRAAQDGSAIAVLSGALQAPRSGIGQLDRLLGGAASITGTLRRSADGALAASEVSVTGAELNFTGEGSRSADGRLDATWQLMLPRLAALDPSLGGAVNVIGTLSGNESAPDATATLTSDGISASTLRLDRLEAHLAVSNLLKPSGRLTAKFSRRDLTGTAAADGTLTGGRLSLSRVRLDAAGTWIDGTIALRLDSGTVDGTLTGTAPNLKPWSALVGTPLGGSATLKARLAGGKGQSVELTLDGKALSLAGASLAKLHATAQLADVLGTPSGRADLEIDQAALGKATVTNLRLGGRSERPGLYALTASAQGQAGEAYRLNASARLSLDPRGQTLDVTQFAGTLGSAPVRLEQALRLTRRDGNLAFADLDLGFDQGRLRGDGSLKGAALALHLKATALPVHRLAELAGYREVSGVLGFEATLSGTRARPQGQLILDGEQLQFAAASRPDLSPLGLVVSADWRDGVVTTKGRLAGPDNAALGFSGRVPLVVAPPGLTPRLPPQGALAFHVEGGGELANLADIAPLGEDRISGHFTVDVSVAGTIASPEASGRLSVRNGRYESLFWGTTLAGIDFDLVGSRQQLVLQNFHASDGAKGSLALAGAVNLAGETGPAFAFTGSFKSFRAVQRDEATATVSGEVGLTGTIAAPRLGAHLRIEQAELRVPERLPQNVQPIAVTLVNSATGEVLSRPEESPQRVALLALVLDVTVDMPGQVFVRGRGLDSEWRGRLTITGTTAAPSIDGNLEVVRGTYNFLGTTATLSSGTISFLGGNRINPEINIEARLSSTDVIAIIRVTGTATQPKIALTSQPELPQDEILSRVLFGTSVSSITAAQGLQIAQAAAALANGGDIGVLERVRQGLGLDRLTLGSATATSPLSNVAMPSTPAGVPSAFPTAGIGSSPTPISAAGNTGAAGTTVNAGKYVASGVYVGVTQGISAGSSAVDVQISVTPHISIDTTAGGEAAGSGIGVTWKLDY